MRLLPKIALLITLLTLLLIGLLSCTAITSQILPTRVPPAEVPTTSPEQLPTAVLDNGAQSPRPELAPISPVTPESATLTERKPIYQVSFVDSNDTLNVRSGPGVGYEIVGELAPDAVGVELTGLEQFIDTSTWVSVQKNGVAGWVNSRFLSEQTDSQMFCQNEEVKVLLAELETAVRNRDSNHFARLAHPERGLQMHLDWWNPKIRLNGDQLSQIFTNEVSYAWGIADGSGNTINGTFREIVLPLFDRDLLATTELACNDIPHGGTAGYVRLPDGYDPINHFAHYRPGEFEWGTWVVGVEQWQGEWYLSYFVHYDREI